MFLVLNLEQINSCYSTFSARSLPKDGGRWKGASFVTAFFLSFHVRFPHKNWLKRVKSNTQSELPLGDILGKTVNPPAPFLFPTLYRFICYPLSWLFALTYLVVNFIFFVHFISLSLSMAYRGVGKPLYWPKPSARLLKTGMESIREGELFLIYTERCTVNVTFCPKEQSPHSKFEKPGNTWFANFVWFLFVFLILFFQNSMH